MAKQFKDTKVSGQVTLRSRETAKGRSLFLDIYHDGTRNKEYLKLYLMPVKTPEDKVTNENTWEAAMAIARERAQGIVKGQAGIKDSKSKILLLDYMDYRVKQLERLAKEAGRAQTNAARQVEKGTLHLKAYIMQKYGKRSITLSDIDKAFCIGYGEYLCKVLSRMNPTSEAKPLSWGTRELYFKALSTALNMAVKEGHLQQNPMRLIDRADVIGKGKPNERVYLTAEELRRLMATPCKREDIGHAFLFSCMCGLRWSDICNIKWGDIHADGDNWRLEIKMVKTLELLYLPLSIEARQFMPERNGQPDTANIFTLPTQTYAEKILGMWAANAGIAKHITFHCGRHTFATLMLTHGADLYTTSKLLGHTNVKTTQIYAKIVDEKKAEAVNLLNGLFNTTDK